MKTNFSILKLIFLLILFANFYAEAQYHLGNPVQCCWALNQIRGRKGVEMPEIASTVSGQELLNKIYQERRIELALEGHLYYDLRRWKLAEIYENAEVRGVKVIKTGDNTFTYDFNNLGLKPVFKAQYYWLPIPRAEIVKSNYTLTQNTGY